MSLSGCSFVIFLLVLTWGHLHCSTLSPVDAFFGKKRQFSQACLATLMLASERTPRFSGMFLSDSLSPVFSTSDEPSYSLESPFETDRLLVAWISALISSISFRSSGSSFDEDEISTTFISIVSKSRLPINNCLNVPFLFHNDNMIPSKWTVWLRGGVGFNIACNYIKHPDACVRACVLGEANQFQFIKPNSFNWR